MSDFYVIPFIKTYLIDPEFVFINLSASSAKTSFQTLRNLQHDFFWNELEPRFGFTHSQLCILSICKWAIQKNISSCNWKTDFNRYSCHLGTVSDLTRFFIWSSASTQEHSFCKCDYCWKAKCQGLYILTEKTPQQLCKDIKVFPIKMVHFEINFTFICDAWELFETGNFSYLFFVMISNINSGNGLVLTNAHVSLRCVHILATLKGSNSKKKSTKSFDLCFW